MCDQDGDGALSDAELNAFQLVCFGMALDPEELQNVKQVRGGGGGGGAGGQHGRGGAGRDAAARQAGAGLCALGWASGRTVQPQ